MAEQLGNLGDTVLTATIDAVNDQWIATTIEVGQDRDWHPLNGRIPFDWMLRKGRELQAEDPFQPGTAWERELRRACAKPVHALCSDDSPWGRPETWGAVQADYLGEAKTESEVLNKLLIIPANIGKLTAMAWQAIFFSTGRHASLADSIRSPFPGLI